MGERIICGVDDSRGAGDAARFADAIADGLGASLLLVHVARVPVVPGASGVPGGHAELRDCALGGGRRLLARVAAETGCVRAERRVELGDPVPGLIMAAEEVDAALVVIGSSGRDALSAALLGGVSVRLCRRAPCPVVVIPPGAFRRVSRPASTEASPPGS